MWVLGVNLQKQTSPELTRPSHGSASFEKRQECFRRDRICFCTLDAAWFTTLRSKRTSSARQPGDIQISPDLGKETSNYVLSSLHLFAIYIYIIYIYIYLQDNERIKLLETKHAKQPVCKWNTMNHHTLPCLSVKHRLKIHLYLFALRIHDTLCRISCIFCRATIEGFK